MSRWRCSQQRENSSIHKGVPTSVTSAHRITFGAVGIGGSQVDLVQFGISAHHFRKGH